MMNHWIHHRDTEDHRDSQRRTLWSAVLALCLGGEHFFIEY